MFNKCFEAYDQTIINFISLTNEKNSEDDSDDFDDLQEPRDSDDDVTVDGDFFLRITKKIMYTAMIYMIFLECVTHLTLKTMIYQNLIIIIILRLVLLKMNNALKFTQVLMSPMNISRLELKMHTVVKLMGLLYQEVVYFVRLRLNWL